MCTSSSELLAAPLHPLRNHSGSPHALQLQEEEKEEAPRTLPLEEAPRAHRNHSGSFCGALPLKEVPCSLLFEEVALPLQKVPLQEVPLKEAPLEEVPLKECRLPLEEVALPLQEVLLKVVPLKEVLLKEAPLEEAPLEECRLPLEEVGLPLQEVVLRLEGVSPRWLGTCNVRMWVALHKRAQHHTEC